MYKCIKLWCACVCVIGRVHRCVDIESGEYLVHRLFYFCMKNRLIEAVSFFGLLCGCFFLFLATRNLQYISLAICIAYSFEITVYLLTR